VGKNVAQGRGGTPCCDNKRFLEGGGLGKNKKRVGKPKSNADNHGAEGKRGGESTLPKKLRKEMTDENVYYRKGEG